MKTRIGRSLAKGGGLIGLLLGGLLTIAVAQERPTLTLDMTVKDALLVEVLNLIAETAQVNILLDERFKEQRVTLTLHGVSAEQALRIISEPIGLTCKVRDGTYVVKPPGTVPEGRLKSVRLLWRERRRAPVRVRELRPPGPPALSAGLAVPGAPEALPRAAEQLDAAPVPQFVGPKPAEPARAQGRLTVEPAEEGRVTLSATNAPMVAVLVKIAEVGRLNLLISPYVPRETTITVRLQNVPAVEALRAIARSAGSECVPLEEEGLPEVYAVVPGFAPAFQPAVSGDRLFLSGMPMPPGDAVRVVSLSVTDVPVREAFRQLGESAGVTIVVDEAVPKDLKVTAQLRVVTLSEALRLLLEQTGLRQVYDWHRRQFIIAPPPQVSVTGPRGAGKYGGFGGYGGLGGVGGDYGGGWGGFGGFSRRFKSGEVRIIAGTVQLTGVRATVQPDGRVKIHFSLSPPTLVAEVTIKNEAGQVVRILKQQRGPVAFWDRKDERGQPVPPGKYTIEVTAKQRTEFTTSQVNASVVINLK